MTDRDALLEVERGFWLADDPRAYYEEHLAEDAVMAFVVGVLDRPAILEAVAGWASVEISGVRISEPAAGTALLLYSAEARTAEGETYRCHASSLYVREAGEWRLAFHQQSPAGD